MFITEPLSPRGGPSWDEQRSRSIPTGRLDRDAFTNDFSRPLPTLSSQPRRRPSRNEVMRSRAELLSQAGETGSKRHLRPGGANNYLLGRNLDRQLLPASSLLLEGLERWPTDDGMRSGFDQVVESVKLVEAPVRYHKWPFEPLPQAKPLTIQKGVPPGQLEAPFMTSVSSEELALAWSGVVEPGYEVDPTIDSEGAKFVLSEFVVLSPKSGLVTRYELEVAEVDALFGVQAWRLLHRGDVATGSACTLRGIRRGIKAVRARVRGANRFGRGYWSREVEIPIPEIPEPDLTEIDEVPAPWIALDLGGLAEFDERLEASRVQHAKEQLLRGLYNNRNVIKVAFTFYALAGVSDVEDDPSTMTMLQFTNFCMGSRLLESEGLGGLSDLDLVFVRASRAAPTVAEQPLATAVDSSGVPVGAGWRKKKGLGLFKKGIMNVMQQQKGAQLLSQTQFVGALLRLASQMYDGSDTLEKKLAQLCSEHISGHVYDELQLVKDDFNTTMRTREMGSVLDRNGPGLLEVFRAYAAADMDGDGTAAGSKAARAAAETMNVRELAEMCEDIEIFDEAFTTMKLLAIFCKVNIDDDLFEQEEEGNSSSELVFDEFEEVVARIFDVAIFQPMMNAGQTANLLDQDGDGDLDEDDIDDLYDECDQDRSGSISVDELAVALRKRLNAGAAYLVARKLVKVADTDGGGTLSREELHDAVHALSSGDADGEDDELELQRVFHDWLGSVFLPAARKAAKKKKLMGGAANLKAAATKVLDVVKGER